MGRQPIDRHPDADLRNEVVRDVARLRDEVGDITGILLAGDTAFSGATEQFDQARDWLNELCGVAGCDVFDVWIVPGNHDVNWGGILKPAEDFRAAVRTHAAAGDHPVSAFTG